MDNLEQSAVKSGSNVITLKCTYCGKMIEQGTYAEVFISNRLAVLHRLCRACVITAVQALELGKQVTECLEDGNSGKRIYVAIESVNPQSNELKSVKEWTGQGLKDIA